MKHIYSRITLLSSLLLIAILIRTTNATAAASRSQNLREEIVDISPSNNEDEESSIPEDDEDGGGSHDGSTKFSWKYHHSDHGIFAGRSLISRDGIKLEYDGSLLPSEPTSTDEYAALKTSDYSEKEWNLMFRAFDESGGGGTFMQQIMKETDIFEQTISRLSPECRRDIFHLRDSSQQHKLWALRMVDSFGILPSGITYGRFSSPGDSEECTSVRVDENIHEGSNMKTPEHYKFHGKYCLLDFRLPMPPRPNRYLSVYDPVLNLTDTKLSELFPGIMNYTAYASLLYDVGYMHAFCIPSSCDKDELVSSIGVAFEGLHLIVNNTIDCQETPDEPEPLDFSQWLSIFILSSVFLNSLCATVVHYIIPKSKPEKDKVKEQVARGEIGSGLKGWVNKNLAKNEFYSECFSIQSNFARLTKSDPRGLTFVHYTRIVAMAFTVIVHTGALGTLQAITKPADASNSESIFRDLIPQMLANAFTSIQIFFFMAGFMLVISTYPAIKRDLGHLSLIEYALKRAIRLVPGLIAAICINFLWPLFADGPMLSYFKRVIVKPCETNWWRTLFFISNYDHVEKMCLRHSYFSASDYQLHLVSYPLLLLLYKNPTISLSIAGIFTIAGFVVQVIICLTKLVLPFMLIDYLDKEVFFNVIHYIHHPTWNHMSAFFYGYIIGYMVVKKIRVNLSPTAIKRIWVFIIPTGLASLFAPYYWNHYKIPIEKWQIVAFILFDKLFVLTACAWISYASLVLSRPPPKKKPVTRTNINLPDIVSLERGDKEKQLQSANNEHSTESTDSNKVTTHSKDTDSSFVIVPSISTTEPSGILAADSNQLTARMGPRQRSSPDFTSDRSSAETAEASGTLRPATSSMKVSAMADVISKQAPRSSGGTGQPEAQPKPKSSANVSNVNILCLVLSRLTFQLYLFNMVFLWIDVNSSKYYWFMSYYFILTKAFSIYISSSLISIVFFVTMESPALSLYITWVKSRAAARTQKREKLKQEAEQANKMLDDGGSIQRAGNVGSGNLDGISMRVGEGDLKQQGPQLSFIDLAPSSQGQGKGNLASDQTKM